MGLYVCVYSLLQNANHTRTYVHTYMECCGMQFDDQHNTCCEREGEREREYYLNINNVLYTCRQTEIGLYMIPAFVYVCIDILAYTLLCVCMYIRNYVYVCVYLFIRCIV